MVEKVLTACARQVQAAIEEVVPENHISPESWSHAKQRRLYCVRIDEVGEFMVEEWLDEV